MSTGQIINLPELSEDTFEFEHFPTKMQAFIFKNWDIVPAQRIAICLKTNLENVKKQAEKMGLPPQKDVSVWLKKGYITIIKVNWHLLPYNQLMTLLGIDRERLAFILKEEDFLSIKLGGQKPDCAELLYRELNEEEEKQTCKMRSIIQSSFAEAEKLPGAKPFDFFAGYCDCGKKTSKSPKKGEVTLDGKWCICDKTGDRNVSFMTRRFVNSVFKNYGVRLQFAKRCDKAIVIEFLNGNFEAEYHEIKISDNEISIKAVDSAAVLRALTFIEGLAQCAGGLNFEAKTYRRKAVFKTRFIYSFCGLYNDALDLDSRIYCPDELLDMYAGTGINGIWIQAILYRLQNYEFDPHLSDGWEMRLKNLSDFIQRAARYGIKIYLYINEPRAMPIEFFDNYPDILGNVRDGCGCLCTSTKRVQSYLAGAIEGLCRAVPDVGGFFTITRSENITNCYSLNTVMTCPRCKNRKSYEVIAEVNEIIEKSAHKVNPDIRVFAWDWSWRLGEFMTPDEIEKCISLMPSGVILQSNRETELPTHIGGVDGTVNDYSVSVCGISPCALTEWNFARKNGHETCAKLQINNSWECSTIPYLPVYPLLAENVELLAKNGIEHLMLSWTLGGYPSPNIKIVSELFFKNADCEKPNYERAYESIYGENSKAVREASQIFAEAFKEFPFHIDTLYTGPQNGGISNPMFLNPTGRKATMTCYAYDDLESWRAIYPPDVFENQFKKLCDIWESGLAIISKISDSEFRDIARATYIQFKSSYNQVRFIRLRDLYMNGDSCDLKTEIADILRLEKNLAKEFFEIMRRNPSIGFEAANHYYYTQGMIKEKVLICEHLLQKILK